MFSEDSDFDSKPLSVRRKLSYQTPPRHRNQFTIRSKQQESDAALKWLEEKMEKEPDASGYFVCHTLSATTGVDITPAGYRRFSHLGRKLLVHKFVYEHQHPPVAEGEQISHLCGNAACCRSSHLIKETRQENMARIGCPGYFQVPDGTLCQACQHQPPCKKVTIVRGLPQVQLEPEQ